MDRGTAYFLISRDESEILIRLLTLAILARHNNHRFLPFDHFSIPTVRQREAASSGFPDIFLTHQVDRPSQNSASCLIRRRELSSSGKVLPPGSQRFCDQEYHSGLRRRNRRMWYRRACYLMAIILPTAVRVPAQAVEHRREFRRQWGIEFQPRPV